MISDLETANMMLLADFPSSEMEDADFILEVTDGTKPEVIRGFHLSRKPRFDYVSGTLSGVSPAYDAEGSQVHHDNPWSARVVMTRLPESDLEAEDTRHYLEIALNNLSREDTPSP